MEKIKKFLIFLKTVQEKTKNIEIYAIQGKYSGSLFGNVDLKVIINCDEQKIWDSYLITVETLIEFFDLVYYELVNQIPKK